MTSTLKPLTCRRAIDSAEKTHERDNIYAAYAKGILADALYAEGKYEEAAGVYAEGLKAYERHYHGKHSPDEIEIAGRACWKDGDSAQCLSKGRHSC